MRHIEFKDGQSDKPLARLDLGEATENGDFDNGDLAPLAGNLYIHVDGEEWGSLYFHAGRDGNPTITLGQYDPWSEEWDERNPLDYPVSQKDPVMERLILAAASHWDGDDKIVEAHLSVQAELIAEVMPERPAHQDHAWITARIREHRKS